MHEHLSKNLRQEKLESKKRETTLGYSAQNVALQLTHGLLKQYVCVCLMPPLVLMNVWGYCLFFKGALSCVQQEKASNQFN